MPKSRMIAPKPAPWPGNALREVRSNADLIHNLEQRVAQLEDALRQFANVAEALIDNHCEVNWTALQCNIIEARRLL